MKKTEGFRSLRLNSIYYNTALRTHYFHSYTYFFIFPVVHVNMPILKICTKLYLTFSGRMFYISYFVKILIFITCFTKWKIITHNFRKEKNIRQLRRQIFTTVRKKKNNVIISILRIRSTQLNLNRHKHIFNSLHSQRLKFPCQRVD